MDFEGAERRFQQLEKARDRGKLDEDAFHLEVAKLLLRDARGLFWMLDADSGTWFCNRGDGWIPGDPHAERAVQLTASTAHRRRRSTRWLLAAGTVFVVLLGLVGMSAYFGWPAAVWTPPTPAPTRSAQVEVSIASPSDGSQVILGQVVAVESTLHAPSGFPAIDLVQLKVDEQEVDTQAIQPKLQPGQTSLPLSLAWQPSASGEYQVVVTALSGEGEAVGSAAVTIQVIDAAPDLPVEPACIPNATFLSDVTIPSDSTFLPGVRMDKVWQVRNSGTCAWGVGYELVLVGGESLGAPRTVSVPATASGESADLAVTFRAPDEIGSHTSVWQIKSPDGSYFGPRLVLDIRVGILAEEDRPPAAPAGLQAVVDEDNQAVRLTWEDQSDNEDAFRINREDVEASIGLAPADAESFVDEGVACGNIYRYHVVAFNAAGVSPRSETAEVTLQPCAPIDAPPTLMLTIVPTQTVISETFTVVFQAEDDLGLGQITIVGEETGDPVLDAGRSYTCTGVTCLGSWPVVWTGEVSTTLTMSAVARDSSGQESDPARAKVDILP
jgi:hypothetical protein